MRPSRRAPDRLQGRSSDLVVHSSVDVNFWISTPPSVEVVRPACCPRCGIASRVPGRRLGLVGHGLRDRQLRGPPTAGGAPTTQTLLARRYRGRTCAAVVTVVPRQVVARRHFSAGAIAFALFIFGKMGATAVDAAKRVGIWARGPSAWRTLRRWIGAIDDGRLFRCVRPSPSGWPPRKRAERAAMVKNARRARSSSCLDEAHPARVPFDPTAALVDRALGREPARGRDDEEAAR